MSDARHAPKAGGGRDSAHTARVWTPGRRPLLVALLAVAITILALFGVGRVRLQADLAVLLPDGGRVAESYRTFLELFGGLEVVFVAVEAAPATATMPAGDIEPADLVRAAAALEVALNVRPEVADARAGVDERDEAFFLRYVLPRAPLLMDDDGRAALAARLSPDAIHRRVAQLHASLSLPTGAIRGRWARSDPLGLAEMLPLLTGSTGLPLDPWASVFLAPAGDVALVMATPTEAEMDPAGGRALAAALDETCAAVASSTGIAFRCRAIGGPLYAAQDERLLRNDLRRTLVASLIATSAVLVVAFEGLVLALAVMAPLLVGLLWGAGWLGWWSPEISAVSIGFGAVLVGLGVDYAVHLAARFRQAYGDGGGARTALAVAAGECGRGIVTSALTTAAGFAVLFLAHLRPLREVGMLVVVGIIAVLAAVATVGAATLVAVAPRIGAPGAAWHWLGRLVDGVVQLAVRRAGTVLVLAMAASIVAGWWCRSLTFDPDLRVLRPADPPARAVETLLADRFGLGLDTVHILVSGHDDAEALGRARAAATVLRAKLPAGATLSSPSDYLVGGDRDRQILEALGALPFAAAADELERSLRESNLNPQAFATGLNALRAFARGEDPGAPLEAQWPRWLISSLRRGAGRTWVSIGLRLPMGVWPAGPPAALVADLAAAAPGAAVVAAGALGAELRTLAASDLRRLVLLAFAAIGAVVVVSFRGRLVPSVLALLPVTLGSLWTLGAWAALGRPLDLFCLAVLPILLGIGIDDGLHGMHGARGSPAASVRGSLQRAGRALLLTTVTTAAGFASLLLSDIPGLRHGGALIAVGVSACWCATMLVLPAIETVSDRIRGQSRETEAGPAPPHAPDGAAMRRWLGAFHVTGVFWFRLHRWGTRVLPTWLIWPTMLLFSSFFFVVLRRARGAAASNLEAVLGPCGWFQRQVRIYKTLWNFAWCLTERYEQLSTDRGVAVEVEGEAEWCRALALPAGLILVTAHIGHWEIASMRVPGRHIHVVREEEIDPRSQAFMRKMFAEQTGSVRFTMHFAHGNPVLGMKLLAALRRGEIVALQGDRPRTGGKVLTTEAFGRPFAVPLGPAALARAAGVPLVPAFVFRTGRRRSRVVIRPPIWVSSTGRAGLDAAAKQIAANVEWAIRQQPHQWFCFRQLWPAESLANVKQQTSLSYESEDRT